MALLTPAYKLTFRQPTGGGALGSGGLGNGKVVDTTSTPQASTVTELTVDLTMDGGADRVSLVMAQVGSFRPAIGDEIDVELGYADPDGSLETVMTGTVVTTEPGLVRRRILAHDAAHTLARTHVDKTFEDVHAGDIVNELAETAGVEVATVDDGIRFPAYVVDGRRDAYQHIGDLAELSGFDRYIDNENKLVFAFFGGGRITHVFEHSKHILEVELEEHPVAVEQVDAFGESPGAQQGDESWAWLTKDFSSFAGSAGSGTVFLIERPVLRTGQAAQRATDAALTEFKRRARRGRVLVTGAPQVRLGDSLRISGSPEQGMDATYQVRAVTHRIDKQGGFTSNIRFRSIEQ
jgi:phage protein D